MLTLYVKYLMKPGMAKPFVEEAESSGVAGKIREEKGCLLYNYFYSAADADTVLLIEQWVEPEDQKVHMTQPHMAQLRAIKDKYVLETVFGEEALR